MRDTIDMVREAGAKDWQKMNSDVEYLMSADALKAFEALVRADEREQALNDATQLVQEPVAVTYKEVADTMNAL